MKGRSGGDFALVEMDDGATMADFEGRVRAVC